MMDGIIWPYINDTNILRGKRKTKVAQHSTMRNKQQNKRWIQIEMKEGCDTHKRVTSLVQIGHEKGSS